MSTIGESECAERFIDASATLAGLDVVERQWQLDVLGGRASSRLDNALVRGSEQAVQVSASAQQHEPTLDGWLSLTEGQPGTVSTKALSAPRKAKRKTLAFLWTRAAEELAP